MDSVPKKKRKLCQGVLSFVNRSPATSQSVNQPEYPTTDGRRDHIMIHDDDRQEKSSSVNPTTSSDVKDKSKPTFNNKWKKTRPWLCYDGKTMWCEECRQKKKDNAMAIHLIYLITMI